MWAFVVRITSDAFERAKSTQAYEPPVQGQENEPDESYLPSSALLKLYANLVMRDNF